MNRLIIVVAFFISLNASAGVNSLEMNDDNGYIEPFQMFDNVYYIGDKWVSSYAVVTSSGLVIIDTLEFPYSKWVPINLKKLGLGDRKVTHIIITHGHSDHVGGAQFLQSLYGSKVVITEKGFDLTKIQARKSNGKNKFLPPVVESFAEDSTRLVIGDTEFKFYITPGHTEGDLSIDFIVKDKDQLYRAFVVGGHGTNFRGVELAEKFVASIGRIKKLAAQSPKASVNLSNHPNKNNLFVNRDKRLTNAAVNPFVDEVGFLQFLDELEKSGIKKLQEELEPTRANKFMQPTVNASADLGV
jgi:metallo-beta-lactamase class B